MTAANFRFSPFLQLGAWWSGRLVGASNRFAASSIMQDWTVVFDGVRHHADRPRLLREHGVGLGQRQSPGP